MKIAIHHREGSFSSHWIDYCKEKNIPYKVVDAYADDITSQLNDCDALMWHHHQGNVADRNVAKQILAAVQQAGKIVYPNFDTGWHFDDKLGQKYMLEAIGAPVVPSHAFFSKESARKWCETASYPLVFKLRGGAGSFNVKLIKSRAHVGRVINQAFGKGFADKRLMESIAYSWKKFRSKQISFRNFINLSISEMLWHLNPNNANPREFGYIYFQDFMPGNTFDMRIVVIAGKYAIGEKRYTRDGDFRASGSGKFDYHDIDPKAVQLAFNTAKKLKLQTAAFDLVYAPDKSIKIVELCYGFGTHGIVHAPGFWTDDMQWHEMGNFNMFGEMVEQVIASINEKSSNQM